MLRWSGVRRPGSSVRLAYAVGLLSQLMIGLVPSSQYCSGSSLKNRRSRGAMVSEGQIGRLVTDDQNIVQMYAKNVLLPLAFLPMPLIFVVAPSNLFQCVYCRPIRKFSHGQNDGPPRLNGK